MGMRHRVAVSYNTGLGEMAERTKAPVSKTGIGATLSWVRIPLSPPLLGTETVQTTRMEWGCLP